MSKSSVSAKESVTQEDACNHEFLIEKKKIAIVYS